MAATSTISSSLQYNATKMLLCYTLIVACLTSQFLSVNAIKCHQCNSHLEEDCNSLRLSTPRGLRDDQFLKECEEQHGQQAFCRKTVLSIEVNGEHRVVRGCGWLRERSGIGNNSCFTADNEGYKQTICTCNQDGCNSSSDLFVSKSTLLAVTVVSVTVAALLKRN